MHVVPNTIFNDFIENKDNTHKDKTILAVSRIVRLKEIDKLIESFRMVSENNPEWKLNIVGPVDDPDYFSSLVAMVNSYGLKEKIFFSGQKSREELIEIYNQSPIYFLFSRSESFSISRLEAIAMGLYVITTDAGCARDFSKYGIHIMENNSPQTGAKYIEDGIKAIETGTFKETDVNIPSYRDIAIQISSIAENKGK